MEKFYCLCKKENIFYFGKSLALNCCKLYIVTAPPAAKTWFAIIRDNCSIIKNDGFYINNKRTNYCSNICELNEAVYQLGKMTSNIEFI